VIDSFNQDKPYDRFVQEQIAGDELWPNDPMAHIATGFNRHYPDESNARVLEQRRQEILDDITDTTGAVYLGLTYGCARCHNHKFDPILQADYYRLQAFYANTAATIIFRCGRPPNSRTIAPNARCGRSRRRNFAPPFRRWWSPTAKWRPKSISISTLQRSRRRSSSRRRRAHPTNR